MTITTPSIVELSDVTGRPKVRQDLPPLMRIGDPIALRFKIQKEQDGRNQLLEVDHRFKVVAVGIDNRGGTLRQLVVVETLGGKPPTWHSVKKAEPYRRVLGPTKFPKTPI
jgi:hypothetical protein